MGEISNSVLQSSDCFYIQLDFHLVNGFVIMSVECIFIIHEIILILIIIPFFSFFGIFQIKPVIEKVIPFEDAPTAYDHVGLAHSRGKTVLNMKPTEESENLT